MKKLISILLTAAMIAAMVPALLVTAAAANTGAWTDAGNYDLSWITPESAASADTVTVDGKFYRVKGHSANTVYEIKDTADLAGLALLSNAATLSDGTAHKSTDNSGKDAWFKDCVFYVTGDIDLAGHDWNPIGNCFNYRFGGDIIGSKGKADGTGAQVIIKNMTINRPNNTTQDATGFVGTMCGGAVKNFKFENTSVTVKCFRTGTVVGQCNVSEVINVSSDATVTVTDGNTNNGWDIAAGMIGACWGGNTFENLTFTGKLKNGSVSGDATGGILGAGESNGVDTLIKNCIVVSESINGGVAADATATGHGGIIGTARHLITVENCYVWANITTSNSRIGGLVGSAWNGITINNSQFDGIVMADGNHRGAFVGYSNPGQAITLIGNLNTGVAVSGAAKMSELTSFALVGSTDVLTISGAKCYTTSNVLYQAKMTTSAPAVVAAEDTFGDGAKTAISKFDWAEKWATRAGMTPVLAIAKDIAPTTYATADLSWLDTNNVTDDQIVITENDLLGLSRLVKACGAKATAEKTDAVDGLFDTFKIKVAKTLESKLTAELFPEAVVTLLKANLVDIKVTEPEDTKPEDTKPEDTDAKGTEGTDANVTEANGTVDGNGNDTDKADKEGCGASVFGGIAIVMATASAAVVATRKKKED